MDRETLKNQLYDLFSYNAETEWIEFKTAENQMDIEDIGQYFSALSNEANIKKKHRAWLVLGVNNNRDIVGTNFKNSRESLNKLKMSISTKTGGHSVIDIHEYIHDDGKRVLMFEIPPSPSGFVVKWGSIGYCREGESLCPITSVKESIITTQDSNDWSGRICYGSSVSDLDEGAVSFLKDTLYKIFKSEDYSSMSTEELLRRLNLMEDGQLLNTAVLLLGKSDSATRLLSDRCRIAWKYIDEKNGIEDREYFDAPILPKLHIVLEKINKFNIKLKEGSLFRQDINQYDALALRELLVNSIAHRDWTINLWVEIKQKPTKISFKNPGNFRADLEQALRNNDRPPYLNKNLSNLLQKINLMEREGGGLAKVYREQFKRGSKIEHIFTSTPAPSVEFTIESKVEDVEFVRLVLNKDKEIDMSDLLYLDKIRNGFNKVGKDISKEVIESLHNKKYIELRGGKHKRAYVSAGLSKNVGDEAKYTSESPMPIEAKKTIIMHHLKKFQKIKVSDGYSLFPKDSKPSVRSLLAQLNKKGFIRRIEVGKNRSDWFYVIDDKNKL